MKIFTFQLLDTESVLYFLAIKCYNPSHMLDIKFIRENPDLIKEAARKKHIDFNVDELISIDQKRLEKLSIVESLRAEQNIVSDKIPTASAEERADLIAKMTILKEDLKKNEEELKEIILDWQKLMLRIPNIPSADTPEGVDESGNVVIRQWGDIPKFDFEIKDHVELGKIHNLIDLEKAAEISGSRFAYLKGEAALIQFAIVNYLFEILGNENTLKLIAEEAGLVSVSTKPFIPVVPPVLIKPNVFGRMDRLEPRDERYHIPGDDLYLIGSAEHTTGPLHMDEIIPESELPIRYIAYSTAFRREAGAAGKDTRGILRVHQFDKLEMETFCLPEHSIQEQDFIVAIQEYFLRKLKLPYQVILICTGDMGKPDYRQIDINTWIPTQNCYRETHTSDLMTSFQSRRLNTRVAREGGKNEYVHMNDATACAIGRTLIAILENYQQPDGTIKIPEVLQKYIGKEFIGK